MIDLLILIFTYLPAIFIHIIPVVAVVMITASFFIPEIIGRKHLVRNVGLALLVLGIYLEGGLAVTNEYLEREKAWADKVKVAEQKSEETNSKIEYVYKDKIVKIKETQVVVQEKIKDVSVKIDSQCKITKDTVDILNTAAKDGGKDE